MPQKSQTYTQKVTITLPYLLSLPKEYGGRSRKKWPLILFLHGAGERGLGDFELLKKHGIPKLAEERDVPFIALSPQCPPNTWWSMDFLLEALIGLLDETGKKYRVDADRIYVTGLSMGGMGTWALATHAPERFAAIAPICGGGDPEKVECLKSIPTWIFHGTKDQTVKPEEAEKMYDALKACGGDVGLTMYPGVGHDSWTATYDNPQFYEWLLAHERKNA